MLKKRLVFLALFLISLVAFGGCNSESTSNPVDSEETYSAPNDSFGLIIPTATGLIEGIRWDEDSLAWLGIPYAKPPVGELRWKAPRDPESWEGIKKADSFCSECPQIGGMLLTMDSSVYGKPVGKEDCLYLNIWRPESPAQKLPVFFWIHGGMNHVGEAATSLYHGAEMAKKNNMVVVTINYRLGPLGSFFHSSLQTGNKFDDSGNYAILDIIKALNWVKTNIENFGGNPQNVTVAGESAGGFNVISLLASPVAKGLFHKAVSMSPTSSETAMSMDDGEKLANTVIAKMLVNDHTAIGPIHANLLLAIKSREWIKKYLYSKSANEILLGVQRFSTFGLNELGLFTTLGTRFEDGTVIPKAFSSTFKNGTINRVPLIIGSNAEETKIFEIALGIITPFDEYELADLIRNFDTDNPGLTLDEIICPVMQKAYEWLGTEIGDLMFRGNGVDPIATDLSNYQDVYVYKFSWNNQPAPMDFLVGASHMTALPFIFGNFQTDKDSMFRFSWSKNNMEDVSRLSEAMMSYWANFSNTGNPNDIQDGLPEWQPWSNISGKLKRINLDNNITFLRN